MSAALFFAIYCLEAGLFFTVAPWTRMWMINPVLHQNATIAMWVDNAFVRGFVSGIGLIHIIIGIRDLMVITREQRRGRAQ